MIYSNRKLCRICIYTLLAALLVLFTGCEAVGSQNETEDDRINSGLKLPSETDETLGNIDEDDAGVPLTKTISFLAAGDNIVHMSVYTDAMTRAQAVAASSGGSASVGKYYFDEMYKNIAPLVKAADIAFVNQEGPIAGESFGISGHPNFNAPNEAGDALVNLGFDIVNIANNHMLDMDTIYRGTGLLNSINYWKTKDVMLIGGYLNKEDYETIRVYEQDGVKIAFLSYTYGVNSGLKLNSGSPELVIPYTNDEDIVRQIAAAKEQAELVFVSMHWGDENTFTPTAEQKRLAKLIADCGADVIIGHHSHTIQPIEWIEGSHGNKTLCIYSLGNFISTQLYSYNMVEALVTFDIIKEGDAKAYIANPIMHPVVCHYNADPNTLDEQELPYRSGVELYLMEDYTEDLAQAHGAQLYGAFTTETLRKYVTDNISPEFLPDYLK